MVEAGQFSLNRPEAQAKDEYLYLWQIYQIDLAHLVCNSDLKFDPRIPRMIRFMISLIAHDSIRHHAETCWDEAMQYANSRKDLPLDERNEMIIRISATMAGNITAYVDQFKGLAHQLKIGELVDMNKKYYQDSLHKSIFEEGEGDEDEMDAFINNDKIVFPNAIGSLVPEDVDTEEDPNAVVTIDHTNDEGEQAVEHDATHGN